MTTQPVRGRAGAASTARTLAIDAATAEAVRALRAAGIACVLLKGPTLLGWLYDEGESHFYSDADLLVAPERYRDAEGVLARLGYAPSRAPHVERFHAHGWRRRSDGAIVDLHRTLPAMRCDPALVWRVVTERVERRSIMGVEVEVPAAEVRTLLIVLHHAHHADEDHPFAHKTLAELKLAVRRIPFETWREAARLATRLNCRVQVSRGLHDDAAGATLASRLHLPPPAWFGGEPHGGTTASFERLASTPGRAAKARLLGSALVPSREYMRWNYSLARRGRRGLAAAYVVRSARALTAWLPALLAWRRVRR